LSIIVWSKLFYFYQKTNIHIADVQRYTEGNLLQSRNDWEGLDDGTWTL